MTTAPTALPTPHPAPRTRSLVLPILLIALGVLFLLGNTGYLNASFWRQLFQLWPLLLVLIGVDLLLRARSQAVALVTNLAIVAVALAYVITSPAVASPATAQTSLPRGNATELAMTVSYGAGELLLAGGASDLVSVGSSRDDVRVQAFDRVGGSARISISPDPTPISFVGGGRWDVRVPSDIPVALTLNLGAGDFRVDLRDVRLTRATISNGASDLRLSAPVAKGDVPIVISTGASSVTIEMPKGVEYRVRTTGGMNSVSGVEETPGYAAAADRLTITISAGASSITIR